MEAAHLIQLSKIKHEMDLTVTNVGTIDSQIKKIAEPLLTSVEDLNNNLRNLYRPGENNFEPAMNAINKGEAEIRGLYEKFLRDFRDIAIKTVKRDLEAIKPLIGSEPFKGCKAFKDCGDYIPIQIERTKMRYIFFTALVYYLLAPVRVRAQQNDPAPIQAS